MLACSAMVGCTNEDLLEDNEQGKIKSDSFLSIKLVNPAPSSRASFENGTENEGKVNAARFYLFKANGDAYIINDANNASVPQNQKVNYVTSTVTPGSPNQTTGGNVETICEAVIVINKSEVAPPASIVAILNPPTDVLGDESLSLTQLQAATMAVNYATIKTVDTDGNTVITAPYIGENKFVMTNSVHIDANNEMLVATPIEAINIQTTADLAKRKPVQIYVERIASKVRVNSLGSKVEVSKDGVVTIPTGEKDATGADITAQIKGWRVTNITEKSNLIKSLSPSYTFSATKWEGWNDAANHRSYWANTTATPVHKWTFNDLTLSAAGGYEYYNENTKNVEGSNSQLLVAAEFLVGGTKKTIAEWYGVKYTLENLKIAIAGTLTKQIYIKDNNDDLVSITDANIDFIQADDDVTNVPSKRYLSYATFMAGTTYYNAAGEELGEDELNTIFANVQPAKIWAAGGYYYVDIEHYATTKTEGEGETEKTVKVSEKALVRNHLYDITISALSGLGTPVYNPDMIITPEKPETDYSYISAKVNVLAWRIVSQNVTLE